MQSKDLHHMKAAIRDQAFLGNARVFCIMGPVVAARHRKGQLLAMIRGWGRWYPVESVRIEYAGRTGTRLLFDLSWANTGGWKDGAGGLCVPPLAPSRWASLYGEYERLVNGSDPGKTQ